VTSTIASCIHAGSASQGGWGSPSASCNTWDAA